MSFNFSTKAASAAIAEIADSIGASADSDMLTRSLRSLNAGIEYLNSRANWDFLLTEADPTLLVPPFSVTGVSASAGQVSAACPVGHGFAVDDVISFPGILAGTRVSATAAGSIGFSTLIQASLGTGTVVVTASGLRDMYAVPSAFKSVHSARTLGNGATLWLYRRRYLDRSISVNEYTASIPRGYDITTIPTRGKLRILPPPNTSDTLELRYFRRMAIASSTSDPATLDMPQDYEGYLIAWSKWHFITDKSEGRGDQMQTWLAFANDGISRMISDQARAPDEDLRFVPGAYSWDPAFGPNSTRYMDWNWSN